MKGLNKGIALLGFLIAAPVFAHHMAEGVISDEIWQRIDSNLEGTPHLDLDLDDPGNMGMDADGVDRMDADVIDGRAYLITTFNVYFTTDWAQQNPEDAIEDYFDAAFIDTMDEMNRVPSGTLNGSTLPVYYEVTDLVDLEDDGYFEYAVVDLYEPIGQGNSQDSDDPDPAPGKRAGG